MLILNTNKANIRKNVSFFNEAKMIGGKLMKKGISLLVLICVIVSLLAGCASSSQPSETSSASAAPSASPATDSEDTFLLGVYLPLSGANASYGFELQNSINMAVDYINANGGMNGAQLETLYYDTTSSTEEAAKITVKMVEVDHVDAVITSPMSTEILASVQTLMDNNILTFALGTSGTVIDEEKWQYLYRSAANNDIALPSVFNLIEERGYTNTAIFYSQDEVAIHIKDLFEEGCKERGIDILDIETFDTGDTDFSAQMTNIVASNPEFVFFSCVGDFTGIAIKQLRQYGYNGIAINKDDIVTAQVDVAGVDNCNYMIFTNPYITYNSIEDCDIQVMKDYLQMYSDTYGNITTSDWPYRGWDSVMTLWEAAKAAGSNDSAAMQAAMSSVQFEGLGGTIDFTDGDHEGYSNFEAFVFLDGKKVLLKNWIANGGYDAYLAETGRAK